MILKYLILALVKLLKTKLTSLKLTVYRIATIFQSVDYAMQVDDVITETDGLPINRIKVMLLTLTVMEL